MTASAAWKRRARAEASQSAGTCPRCVTRFVASNRALCAHCLRARRIQEGRRRARLRRIATSQSLEVALADAKVLAGTKPAAPAKSIRWAVAVRDQIVT